MTSEKQTPIDSEKLQNLHETVNAMLDIPVPNEGDEFPLPTEAIVPDQPAERSSATPG